MPPTYACRSTIPGGVEIVFCSDQSADTWLVREVEVLQAEGKTPQVSSPGPLLCCCASIYRTLASACIVILVLLWAGGYPMSKTCVEGCQPSYMS